MTDELNKTHADYDKYLPIWTKIDDICDGENLQSYLIKLNPLDTSDENVVRNKQYYERAVFYAIAGYTVRGMVGMLFRKEPSLSVEPGLEYVTTNIDGVGQSIYQQSQAVCKDLVKKGRCGLWVDFPETDGNTSKADIENLKVFATVKKFDTTQIIDWKTETFGAKIYLSRILIKYTEEVEDEDVEVRLELFIEEGVYRVKKWQKKATSSQYELVSDYTPTDSAGNYWSQIPFTFVGAETNTFSIDQPPSLDIVRINIGHWNNSASYEDSVWFAGQVQPWMSGITEDYIKMLNDNKMYVGSGRLLGVPSGEQFGYAQSRPNPASKEAMNDKVEMMIGLGAMFLQSGSAVKTATQSEGEKEIRHSVLSLIASNVSEAYEQALVWASMYMGTNTEQVEYQITQEFVKPSATSADLKEIVASLMQGAIPFNDYVKWCQKYGYIDESKTPEEVSDELEWKKNDIDFDEDEDLEDEE
jgi:hypothetical protein